MPSVPTPGNWNAQPWGIFTVWEETIPPSPSLSWEQIICSLSGGESLFMTTLPFKFPCDFFNNWPNLSSYTISFSPASGRRAVLRFRALIWAHISPSLRWNIVDSLYRALLTLAFSLSQIAVTKGASPTRLVTSGGGPTRPAVTC